MKKLIFLIISSCIYTQGQTIKIEKLADLPKPYTNLKISPKGDLLVYSGNLNISPTKKLLFYDTLGFFQKQYPFDSISEFSFGAGNSAVFYTFMKYYYVEDFFKYLDKEKTYRRSLKDFLKDNMLLNPEPFVLDKYNNIYAISSNRVFENERDTVIYFLIKNNNNNQSKQLNLDSRASSIDYDSYNDQIHVSSNWSILIYDTSLTIIKEIPLTNNYQRYVHFMRSSPNKIVSIWGGSIYFMNESYEVSKTYDLAALNDYSLSSPESDIKGNLYLVADKKSDGSLSLWKISFSETVTEVSEDLNTEASVFAKDGKLQVKCDDFQYVEAYDLMGRKEVFYTPEIRSNMQGVLMLFIHTNSSKVVKIKAYGHD